MIKVYNVMVTLSIYYGMFSLYNDIVYMFKYLIN